MTAADWDAILADVILSVVRRGQGQSPVHLDALEEDIDACGWWDLRRLCMERGETLAAAGLQYDDEHRAVVPAAITSTWTLEHPT